MKSLFAALVLLAAAQPALAQSAGIDPFGIRIGMIVGAESFCGLTYDRAAVRDFLKTDERTQSSAFGTTFQFVSTTWAKTAKEGLEEAIETHGAEAAEKAKASMCDRVKQGAEEHGFIE